VKLLEKSLRHLAGTHRGSLARLNEELSRMTASGPSRHPARNNQLSVVVIGARILGILGVAVAALRL